MKNIQKIIWKLLFLVLFSTTVFSQSPTRVGTTAAEFLSIGYGPAGCALGDAYTSMADDITSVYWNPAGLSFMTQNEVMFSYQPWLADISTYFTAVGIVTPNLGTLAIGLIGVDYGEMNVTTVQMQQGTGETFFANDYAFSLSYGRKLASWFGFGASGKYIRSSIWHTSAQALAVDLGVLIQTPFFSVTGNEANGLKIAMSLSNYGTKMKYSGIDLLNAVDISPGEAGNYKDSRVNFETDEWDIPLIFRLGFSIQPIVFGQHRLTIATDALHVNNNNESLNVGAEYAVSVPGVGKLNLRGGYRALFLSDSEFGPTFGVGVLKQLFGNVGIQVDYAYRDVGLLGYTNIFGLNMKF